MSFLLGDEKWCQMFLGMAVTKYDTSGQWNTVPGMFYVLKFYFITELLKYYTATVWQRYITSKVVNFVDFHCLILKLIELKKSVSGTGLVPVFMPASKSIEYIVTFFNTN